jgi:hypothetical protein
MLTQNQKQLIENLEKEFAKLNKSTEKTSNRLINKIDMDNRRNESNVIISELRAVEKANNESIQEMIERDINRLNEDLNEMGLIAVRPTGLSTYLIEIRKQNDYDAKRFYFEYTRTSIYHSLPDKSTCQYYSKFNGISIYLTDCRADKFNNLDNLCSDSRFVRRIENMYYSLSK